MREHGIPGEHTHRFGYQYKTDSVGCMVNGSNNQMKKLYTMY